MLHALALVLLVIVVVRLALDLVCLVCRAAIWLLLQVCLVVEAGLDRLRTSGSRTAPTPAPLLPHELQLHSRHGAAADWDAYSAAYWRDYSAQRLLRERRDQN